MFIAWLNRKKKFVPYKISPPFFFHGLEWPNTHRRRSHKSCFRVQGGQTFLLGQLKNRSEKTDNVATLAFGLRPRQGGCKVTCLEVDPGVTSHAPGSAKSPESVREWTLTLPSELPRWELLKVGVPKGLPKLQRVIWGVKSQWLVVLFISMESSWSVDV